MIIGLLTFLVTWAVVWFAASFVLLFALWLVVVVLDVIFPTRKPQPEAKRPKPKLAWSRDRQ